MHPFPPLVPLPFVCYICKGLRGFSKTVRSMFGYLLGRTWCLHCRAPPDAVLCVFVVCVVQSSVAINHTGNVARSKSESALSIELIESESSLIISDIYFFNKKLFKKRKHFSGEIFNLNNNFIKNIYSTIVIENALSQSQMSMIKDLFEELNRLIDNKKISPENIDNLNKTYGEELKKIGIDYTFSKSDFVC